MENDIILSPIRLQELKNIIGECVKTEVLAALGNQQQDKLLSPGEACKLFSPAISKVTLSRWTNDGLIPVQRAGGRLWYKHSDIMLAGTTLKRYKARG